MENGKGEKQMESNTVSFAVVWDYNPAQWQLTHRLVCYCLAAVYGK